MHWPTVNRCMIRTGIAPYRSELGHSRIPKNCTVEIAINATGQEFYSCPAMITSEIYRRISLRISTALFSLCQASLTCRAKASQRASQSASASVSCKTGFRETKSAWGIPSELVRVTVSPRLSSSSRLLKRLVWITHPILTKRCPQIMVSLEPNQRKELTNDRHGHLLADIVRHD